MLGKILLDPKLLEVFLGLIKLPGFRKNRQYLTMMQVGIDQGYMPVHEVIKENLIAHDHDNICLDRLTILNIQNSTPRLPRWPQRRRLHKFSK